MNLIINSLANFRITLFREYPYLYDGRMEDEQAHLTHYTNSPNSIILTHTINNEVIGIATGLPLCEEDPAVQAPFLNTPAP
ncbi:MAG: GNAT family N-acetyltransferase, partial [Fibrobacteres bacterium]|nr:GNAT family N-acetyltransferase [Fibrobacterota bacterium]